tara:strand:- start:3715 stop:3972 length:258 start_codon:yes stop_codon:yes gene_type:complete
MSEIQRYTLGCDRDGELGDWYDEEGEWYKVEDVRTEIKRLKRMLEEADCPDDCHSGRVRYFNAEGNYVYDECEWCEERANIIGGE